MIAILPTPIALPTSRQVPWLRGWAPLVVLPAAAILLVPAGWPRWGFMWVLAAAIYVGCKWLTWRRTPVQNLPWWIHAGYLLAWPGLNARAFLNSCPKPKPAAPDGIEWHFASGKLALGIVLLFIAGRWLLSVQTYLMGWVAMIGMVMVLHFGIFHLLSCGWRTLGVEARPLMHWPLAARSVGDFWGKRWNTAFRDLAHRFLFKPMAARYGGAAALFAGFVFSGVVHDLVISLPAGGGYGGPTLFFLVQAAAILAERSSLGRKLGLGGGWRGWLFTMLALLLPAYGLFHPPFVFNIVVPFVQALAGNA